MDDAPLCLRPDPEAAGVFLLDVYRIRTEEGDIVIFGRFNAEHLTSAAAFIAEARRQQLDPTDDELQAIWMAWAHDQDQIHPLGD